MPGARTLFILVLGLVPLTACGHGPDAAAGDLPEGAVEVDEGYYMVPIGSDEDGCMMYRAHAPGMLTDQAIRFRKADGSFTMNKEEAACEGRD